MTKIIFFGILEFEHWNLFVIWCLGSGASPRYALCALRYAILLLSGTSSR